MVTTIKSGASKEEIRSVFLKLELQRDTRKHFDAHRFCGTVKFTEDGLEYQKRVRNEW